MIRSLLHAGRRFSPFQLINRYRTQHGQRKSLFWLIILGVVAFLVILVGSTLILLLLAREPVPSTGPQFYDPISITFTSSTSYTQALNEVTNLGFHPGMVCSTNIPLSTPGHQNIVRLWQPMGQKETFPVEHRLSVLASVYAPSDWTQRLHTTPGVQDVQQMHYPLPPCSSSHIAFGTPPSAVTVPLSAAEATMYAHITFTSPLNTYNAALSAVSNLGLLLADPCYERELSTYEQSIHYPWNSKPSWHSMSQERPFNTTSTLVIETSPMVTSSLWQSQLHALPGVVNIKTFSTAACSQ